MLSIPTAGAGGLWQRPPCTDKAQIAKQGCRCLAAASSLHLPPPLKHHTLMERSWPSCALCSSLTQGFQMALAAGPATSGRKRPPKTFSLYTERTGFSKPCRIDVSGPQLTRWFFTTMKLDFNGMAREAARCLKPWLQTEERRQNVSRGPPHLAHLPAHLMRLFKSSKAFHAFFPMTIQHGFKPESLHSLPPLILYI